MTSALIDAADGARRRNRQGEQRRLEFIEAGVALVASQGISHTRVADIARAIGAPRSLFYWYFKDVNDLLSMAIIDSRHNVRRAIADATAGVDDVLGQLFLAAQVSARIGMSGELDRVLTTVAIESATGVSFAAELSKTIEVLIADGVLLIARGQAEGVLRCDKPARDLAYCMRAVVHHNVALYHQGLLTGDADELSMSIASYAVAGLCPPSPALVAVEHAYANRHRTEGVRDAG